MTAPAPQADGYWLTVNGCRDAHISWFRGMEVPGGWRDKGTGHAHWVPAGDEPVEPSPLAGVPLTAPADPPRLQALALPDGRFVLVVTGGGLADGDYDTLRNLGKSVGAADVAVFVGNLEVH